MNFVFFGTSTRSADFLDQITATGFKPALVISVPPKPVGHRETFIENPAVTTAKKLSLPFFDNLDEVLKNPCGDLGLILDFNRIIPQRVLDRFPKGIVNIHFSKLPLDRGPARGQQFILRGEPEAWISYFLLIPALDEGPLLAQTSLTLTGKETFGELSDRLVTKAAAEIGAIINDYLAGKIAPRLQPGKPTFARKFTKEDFFIPAETLKIALTPKLHSCKVAQLQSKNNKKQPYFTMQLSSIEALRLCGCTVCLDKLIRAASPTPGAWTKIKLQSDKATKIQRRENSSSETVPLCNSTAFMKRLKLLKVHLESEKLILDEVQLEGKNPVSWRQFCEGYPETDLCR